MEGRTVHWHDLLDYKPTIIVTAILQRKAGKGFSYFGEFTKLIQLGHRGKKYDERNVPIVFAIVFPVVFDGFYYSL